MNNKKILSILLAGTMLNGLVPYNVFANEEKLQEEQEKAVVEIVEDSKEKTLHKKEDTLEKSIKEEKIEEEPKIKDEVQKDSPKIEEKLNFRKTQTILEEDEIKGNKKKLDNIEYIKNESSPRVSDVIYDGTLDVDKNGKAIFKIKVIGSNLGGKKAILSCSPKRDIENKKEYTLQDKQIQELELEIRGLEDKYLTSTELTIKDDSNIYYDHGYTLGIRKDIKLNIIPVSEGFNSNNIVIDEKTEKNFWVLEERLNKELSKNIKEGYNIEGYYLDRECKYKIDNNMRIDSDLNIYVTLKNKNGDIIKLDKIEDIKNESSPRVSDVIYDGTLDVDKNGKAIFKIKVIGSNLGGKKAILSCSPKRDIENKKEYTLQDKQIQELELEIRGLEDKYLTSTELTIKDDSNIYYDHGYTLGIRKDIKLNIIPVSEGFNSNNIVIDEKTEKNFWVLEERLNKELSKNIKEGYNIEGYYLDRECKYKIDNNMRIDSDLNIYVTLKNKNENSSNNNSSNSNSSNNSSSKDDDDSKYDKGDKISVRDLRIDEKSNNRTRVRGHINRHNNSYVSIYNDGYYVDYVKTDSDGDFDITIDEEVDSKSDLKFYAGKVRNKLDGEKSKKEDNKKDLDEIAEEIINKHSNDTIPTTNKISGYVKGYSDNTFKPNNKVTRAEAVSMFARLINGSDNFNNSNNKFSDVDGWYKDAVNFISEKGLMNGYSDGTFKPNNEMTRAEFATMISKYINAGNIEKTFIDISGHWAEDAIAKVSSAGIINGYPSGEFKPDATITRAEAIAMLNRVFNKSTSGANVEFSDVKESDWFYEEIAKAIN